jgi:hypothetical protein
MKWKPGRRQISILLCGFAQSMHQREFAAIEVSRRAS